MPISRSLIAVACVAGLLALPSAATAQRGKSATSHVIKTPKGSQLAVPISVRYKLNGKGKGLAESILRTRVTAAAKLPSGRVLRGVERRAVPGKASLRVQHHVFFSVRQTRVLRKALAARQKVKLGVTAAARVDLDGNGTTDARSTQKSSLTLARPRKAKAPAPLKHQQGSNPCGVLGLSSATCTNVTGSTFTAHHFWDSTTVGISCPSGFPYTTGSVSTQTSSRHYTQTVTEPGPTNGRTDVFIIDDNRTGHPISYTPTVACSTTSQGGGGGL